MSLSRILNDEPSPALSAGPSYNNASRPAPIDIVQRDAPPPARFLNASPRSQSHLLEQPYRSSLPVGRDQRELRSAPPGSGSWDHYSGSSARDSAASMHASGSRPDERDIRVPPNSYYRGQVHLQENGLDNGMPHKRRKPNHDGDSFSAVHPSAIHPDLRGEPSIHGGVQLRPVNYSPPIPKYSAEEEKYNSSDLEDCEEIWRQELDEYMFQTRRRHRQVEQWFLESNREKTAKTAEKMSHYYSRKIVRIPLTPASPPPDPNDGFNGYEYPDLPDDQIMPLDSSPPSEDEMNVGQFPEPPPPPTITATATKSRKGAKGKRPIADMQSDASSDGEGVGAPESKKRGPPAKKRKVAAEKAAHALEISLSSNPEQLTTVSKGKGKAKAKAPAEQEAKSQRRQGPRKKAAAPDAPSPAATSTSAPLPSESLYGSPSLAPSVGGDVTPSLSLSRAPSPAPTNASTIIFELDEEAPALKKAKKTDEAMMLKRVKALEDAQKKVWTNIARREVAKVYKYHALGYQAKIQQAERIAKSASLHARKPFTKTPKAIKDTQTKAKRLMREMQVFWKKNEREERDVRKREHKEAMDRMKMEEEKREAARQARKLEFLISQTELYSHFVGNKLKTSEVEGKPDALAVPAGAELDDVLGEQLQDIDFDNEDKSNLYRHARYNAQEALAMARQKAQEFDAQAAIYRRANESKAPSGNGDVDIEKEDEPRQQSGLVDLDSDELNFQNPTSLSGPLTISQPKMLMTQLKEYQLKGLNWLGTLYEQGINGILADEMGLGKTVQSISLLAHLAEVHDIWGPFLVVAPASTLHNWQQEISRFVPRLKALPYWGNVKDRTTLRKVWGKKEISYNQDAPFHVLITSYQLVTQDQQHFQRVKWQYMILDEAQNIKNSASVRWKTLLGFQCRNRLLLTGTPIQNSMQELWALLHFIMPSLFDSHDEFNEWFSKDIENAASDNKGSKLNEHQLRRLHMILKPFMLRRVKKHVQNELSEKIEEDIYVSLSARQKSLYKALLSKVSISDLLARAANIGDAESARTLMNLVMQFRKVCNHPELFERADVRAPLSFVSFGRPGPLNREGDLVLLPYSTRNPIELSLPSLVVDGDDILGAADLSRAGGLTKTFNIWTTEWIHRSLYESKDLSRFSWVSMSGTSPQEAHSLHVSPLMTRRLLAIQEEHRKQEDKPFSFDVDFAAHSLRHPWDIDVAPGISQLLVMDTLPRLDSISSAVWRDTCLSRPDMKWYQPRVIAPPISLTTGSRACLQMHSRLLHSPSESLALYGAPLSLRNEPTAVLEYNQRCPGISLSGLFGSSPSDQLPATLMQVPEAKRLIYDSAKLARLDTLLQELKAGDHRVLIYFQMTRMMDLMEEYLIYRQYKYLRLDGSSKLEDRRDMVIDWQTKPEIFVFLLSTRAGGLGINLTAADTVIFYDHDWNPSNDAQAMDRAHRLGQTRQVTVYRLITKGTIDERIIQLARVKKDVQDIVVGSKNLTDIAKPSEIVQLLLNDDQLGELKVSSNADLSSHDKSSAITDSNLWDNNEDGDDFFGHTVSTAGVAQTADFTEEGPAASSSRGRKRKPATRGRRGGGKKRGTGDVDVTGD